VSDARLLEFDTRLCRLRLDAASGDLRGLGWREPRLETIREGRLGENFRVLLPAPGYEASYFNSRDQVVSRIEETADGVTCVYDRLRNDRETVDVRVEYRIECHGDGLELSIEIDNGTERPVAEVLYGILGGLHGVGARAETESLIPGAHTNLAPNIFHTFPAGEYGGGNLGIRYSAGGYLYPGYAGLSMSWVSFYNRRKQVALYYANHDPETRLTGVYLELRPYSSSTVRGSNWPSRHELPDDEPIGLSTGWLNFPYSGRGKASFGPVVVRVHPGDWHESSAIYRTWFDSRFAVRSASSLRREMAWQSTILRNPEDVTVHRFSDLEAMAADAKKYGVTAFEICGWDVGGIDRGYPDYSPDPELGSREEFRAALESIRRQGVRPIVFANLQVADTGAPQFGGLHDFVLHGRWAEDLVLLGFGEGTISARLGLTRSNMAILGLGHPDVRDLLADQMIDLVEDGAAALQLDKTTVLQYLDFNERLPVSPDRSLSEGLLSLLAAIRARAEDVDADFALATEAWWDRTFQHVDVLYTRMVDVDIPSAALLFTFPEIASTTFAENPGDFNVMNNGMRYGMVWALAPRHYSDSLDERLTRPLAEYVSELVRIRTRHQDILFHGRFRDTLGAEVRRHPDLRYSVFRSAEEHDSRQACVLVNFGSRPVETSVTWAGSSGRVEVCQPHRPDRVGTLPAAVLLPPRGCAVVVDVS
jgi:hypothetical protein